MPLRERVLPRLRRGVRRYPRQALVASLAFPWALYSISGVGRSPWGAVADLAGITGVGAAVVVSVVRSEVRPQRWPSTIAIYVAAINFGVAEFAYLYWSLSCHDHHAFSEGLTKLDGAYFAWTTFSTTGFGDISAKSQLARLFVTAQMALSFTAVAGGLGVVLSSRNGPDLSSGQPGDPAASPA